MPQHTLGAVLAAATLASAAGHAQQLEPRSIPTKDMEAFRFRSPSMGEVYDVGIALPEGYRDHPDRRYPALVATDGNMTFTMVADAARGLATQGDAEPLVVISVGVPLEEGEPGWTRRRIYEFSPSWPLEDAFGKVVAGYCTRNKLAPGRCVGGQEKFLNMIAAELLPKLADRYRIDAKRLGLFGVSAGGYFASWVMFQPNSPFSSYLISSPAMAYGNGEIFQREAKFAAEHRDFPASVYLASGSLEMDDPTLEGTGQIVSGQARLAAALKSRSYPSLRLFTEIHQGLGHVDVASTTLARGIRLLYPMPKAESPSIFVAIYWKARPGKEEAYADYIRKVAGPIDDEAQRAGAFEELRTYLSGQSDGEWSHLRVFRFKDQAQYDGFSAAMDAAGKRVYPDESKRPKADDLRDLVKRETWRSFK